jgi:hypothetical protein
VLTKAVGSIPIASIEVLAAATSAAEIPLITYSTLNVSLAESRRRRLVLVIVTEIEANANPGITGASVVTKAALKAILCSSVKAAAVKPCRIMIPAYCSVPDVGDAVGAVVGEAVGSDVGEAVSLTVGAAVGAGVGAGVALQW